MLYVHKLIRFIQHVHYDRKEYKSLDYYTPLLFNIYNDNTVKNDIDPQHEYLRIIWLDRS